MILAGNEHSEIELITSVLHYINLNKKYKKCIWWVVVMDVFSLGSTAAKDLCKTFNINPDGKIK